MGFHYNFHMENTKKIAHFILLLLVLPYSCRGQRDKSSIKNGDLIIKNSDGNIVIKLPLHNKQVDKKTAYIVGDAVFIQSVYTQNNVLKVRNVIDVATFDWLYNFEEDKEKIDNQYYITNPVDNYCKDSKNIYIYRYLSLEKPVFFIAGSVSDYEVLGGAYLLTDKKLYWRGEEIKNVDLKTFKTLKVMRKNSEWEATIAIDKNNLYNGNRIMTIEEAKNNYLIDNSIISGFLEEEK